MPVIGGDHVYVRTRNVRIMENSQLPRDSPSRRNVLRAGLATGVASTTLAGCGADGGRGVSAEERELRKHAARDTAELIASFDATAAAHPSLAEELRALRADLVRHLDSLVRRTGKPNASPSREPSGTRKTPGGAARVPSQVKAARHALADATQKVVDARTKDLVGAPPELARLLASVAASGAGHVLLLRS